MHFSKTPVTWNSLTAFRHISSVSKSNNEISPFVFNRNPRNLEKMRIARKPVGYGFDRKNVEYWHKLLVEQSNRCVTASLIHNNSNVVVTASTREWCIRKFLYSPTDTLAYKLLARVFAERCIETGINTCLNEIDPVKDSKMSLFLETLQNEGIDLNEAPVYDPVFIWHKIPEKKPWLVHSD